MIQYRLVYPGVDESLASDLHDVQLYYIVLGVAKPHSEYLLVLVRVTLRCHHRDYFYHSSRMREGSCEEVSCMGLESKQSQITICRRDS